MPVVAIRYEEPRKPNPRKIYYYEYMNVVKKCVGICNRLVFELLPGDKFYGDSCVANISGLTNDTKIPIQLPVNLSIARNLIHIVRNEPLQDLVGNWKLFEAGVVEVPAEYKAVSDIFALLDYIRKVIGRNADLYTFSDDYYSFEWTTYYPFEKYDYKIKVKLKKTIETTCELRDRGLPYDGDSLKLQK